MKGEALSRVRFVGVRGFPGVVERVSRNPAARTACLPAPGSKAASTAAPLSAGRVPTALGWGSSYPRFLVEETTAQRASSMGGPWPDAHVPAAGVLPASLRGTSSEPLRGR